MKNIINDHRMSKTVIIRKATRNAVRMISFNLIVFFAITFSLSFLCETQAAPLKAGVAKINITNEKGQGLVNDSLYAKALVLDNGSAQVVIITLDARALGDKGSVSNDFTGILRSRIQKELGIKPENIMVTASGISDDGLCSDLEGRIFHAVKIASQNMVPVNIGVGTGHEDRITENRRLRLTNGKEWTIRHANPLPPDEEVGGIGPIDPEIGILRLDKKNGETLAVVYNFTVHPYQGVPNKGLTADVPGFASKVIEKNMDNGTMAFFLQGCLGNISTVLYKDVNNPRDAESLGNILGLSTLNALKNIKSKPGNELRVISEIIELPTRTDIPQRIESLLAEQEKLLASLRGTSLNFKTFMPLYIKYNIFEQYPSYYSHRYLNDKMHGRKDLEQLDNENRRNIDKYMRNIYAMEKLTRIQGNISILKEQEKKLAGSIGRNVRFEIQCLKIGSFVLVTFSGEPVVEIGLNIKKASPFEYTFITAYSNGCVGYSPTAEHYKGEALEDTYCILAPEWQEIYEKKVIEILGRL